MLYSISEKLAFVVLGATVLVALSSGFSNASDLSDEITLSPENQIVLSEVDMDENRGAANINTLVTSQSLAGTTSGNTLEVGGDLTNGNVSLGSNFSGMGSYVMNTGNNSTINSAVNLSVQILPSP